ncbi:MAG: RagB/SusD family nutrient uptake outer membrane protein [Tannerella sp.]|nr:RagB/SusD family nutrient uptake outer membrane protein [Tannerella sp.]
MKDFMIRCMILGALIFHSCVDLEQIPYSSLTPENFFKNESDAKSAVMSAYAGFTNQDVFNQYTEVVHTQGTDDAEWGNGRNTNNVNKNEFDKFIYTPESKLVYDIWVAYYSAINTCNYAIDNISAMPDGAVSETRRRNLVAEAKFLRAVYYFNMVRYWGGVPLREHQTTSLEDLEVTRNSADEVYQLIIADLSDAEENLPSVRDYAAADIGRATRGAAAGLLAKVYLTREEWAKVVTQTDRVMQSGEYSLNASYADNFNLDKENGPESLFDIQYMAGPDNVGSNFNGFFRPPFVTLNGWAGYGDNPVTKNLWDAYGANPDGTCDDTRRNVNIRLYTREEYPGMSSTILYPYYCNKYLDFTALATRSHSGNNYPVLRYSDIYLMRAEALGRQNVSDPEAYRYLNIIRRRAYGMPLDQPAACDVAPTGSVDEFVNLILRERRLEFAFEAQRWFDLVRTRKLKDAMMAQDPAVGSAVQDKHYIFPIPQAERDANPRLEQQDLWN